MKSILNHTVLISSTLAILGLSSALQAQESWKTAAPLITGLQEIYTDTLDGKIYLGGGIPKDDANFTDQFTSYDPTADQWTNLSPVPEKRHHLTISAVEDKIYAMGGFTGALPNWKVHASMFIYNPKTDVWHDGVAMPTPRGEHVSAVVDGKIYAIGGRIGATPETNHVAEYLDSKLNEVFNPLTMSWSRLADAPTARNSAATAVIDGKIYVVGGRQNQFDLYGNMQLVNVNSLEVYDPKSNTWETRASMPLAQAGIAAASVNGKLYVFGGEQWFPEEKLFNNAWVYDPKENRWGALPNMSVPRHGLAAAALKNNIYVFGGAITPGLGAVDLNEVLTIIE